MEKVRDVVKFLNPDQTPIITADQPLVVLAKQIQWEWDTECGETKYVVIFGGLHIEMACFKLLGDLLRNDHNILFELKSWSVNLTVISHSYSL
jgi:hypothetical protein